MYTSLIGFGMSHCSFCSKRLFAKATEVSVRLNMKLINVGLFQPFLPPNARCQEHVQMRPKHNEAEGQASGEVREDSKRSTVLREERWRMWEEAVSEACWIIWNYWQFHIACSWDGTWDGNLVTWEPELWSAQSSDLGKLPHAYMHYKAYICAIG